MKNVDRLLVIFSTFLCFIIIWIAAGNTYPVDNKEELVTYQEFLAKLENEEISEVSIDEGSFVASFNDKDGHTYITQYIPSEDNLQKLVEKNIPIDYRFPPESGSFNFSSIIMLGMLAYFLYKYMASSNSTALSFDKKNDVSSSKTDVPTNVRLSDVAGIDEVKKDFFLIIDGLQNPRKYKNMGARITNGIILEGPPGTGKTLLAKAIAAEADVPFFSTSGSEFMEQYVGVGAKRVRELFSKARANAPCIVFIDEIDAIGKKRSNGGSTGGDSERDQTLNQLLVEMDGFRTGNQDKSVIVIAATNRASILDDALVRPGRFDRIIGISLPNKKERASILKVHSKNKQLSDEVNIEDIADMTRGLSGAGLEAMLNEAAILAVSDKSNCIKPCHIEKAFFQQVLKGNIKESQEKNEKDKKLTAYHEAGHALVSKLLTEKKIPKVTILSTSNGAGGVTIRTEEDYMCMNKRDFKNEIMVCYGGRVGEMMLYGDEELLTTGAGQDIKQATHLLRLYIKEYGMSDEYGMINVDQFLASSTQVAVVQNEKDLNLAKEMAKDLYDQTFKLIEANKEAFLAIANTLLEKENINNEELDELIKKTA